MTEMIILRSLREIARIQAASKIAADTLTLLKRHARPGISTAELDRMAEEYIVSQGAIPACKGYQGFPSSVCISPNEGVVHGIPSERKILRAGDIVSFDLVVEKDGFMGDTAITVPVGEVDAESRQLLAVTEGALQAGIAAAQAGAHVGDIGHAVSAYVAPYRYGIVRDFVGHGIGTEMHAEPQVPNYGKPGKGERLEVGMVLCIEPMVNAGTAKVKTLRDRWTVVTADKKRSAHFEHTIAITADGPMILTERSE